MPLHLFRIVLTAGLWTSAALTPAAQTFDACAIEGVRRIVAVGDVHGGYDEFARILRAAGLIDARQRWAGGDTYFVQTGDVVDRGADSRRALDLLRRLEREATKSRGRVVALVGNHEVMRLLGIVRDTSPAEIDAFRTAQSAEIRDHVRQRWLTPQRDAARASGTKLDEAALTTTFDAETPLGLVEMLNGFSEKGEYGKWIRGNAAAARINGILFLHGGVSPRVAPLGCAGINDGIRRDITVGLETVRQAPLESLSMSEDGPLWYRGLAQEDEETFAPQVDAILEQVGARAMVIGHTVSENGRIRPRFNRRVVQIDTGMLASVYKGGRPSALEIVGDQWTAIYEDGKQVLSTSTNGQAKDADPFQRLAPLLGRWEGTSEGKPGKGTVRREYTRALNARFIRLLNRNEYPPQEKNPKGEVHEDEGFFSFDRARKRLVLRQFHVEGFVNHYVEDDTSSADKVVFTSEAIENIPAGWRARETYVLHGPDAFEEIFELAEPGKPFEIYSRARLNRMK